MADRDPISDEDLQRIRLEPLTLHQSTITGGLRPELADPVRKEAAASAGCCGPAVQLEHAGSTSVPGRPSPIIDIILVVRDSSDEPSYVRP